VKIIYDHQIQSLQLKGGISRYFNFLEREFSCNEDFQIFNTTKFSNNIYVEEPTNIKKFLEAKEFRRKNILLNKINQFFTLKMLKKLKYDLFHPTYYDPYFIDVIRSPYIITVHDMIHELLPEYVSPRDKTATFKKKSILNADRIIAISNTTKRDLIDILKVDKELIDVIPHSYFPTKNKVDIKPLNCPDNFILFVGERHSYKNFTQSLPHISPFLKKHNATLFCVGGNQFTRTETELINNLDINNLIVQKNVSDGELSWLYKNAIFFIFPSLYEGFGLPILEAFKNQCPCLLFSSDCFNEIADDGALFFKNYFDLGAICEELYQSKTLRNELIIKGEKKLLHYSPANTLASTMNAYKKTISH
jgi:glycosyltransferase involved in cell wall biosynthesis